MDTRLDLQAGNLSDSTFLPLGSARKKRRIEPKESKAPIARRRLSLTIPKKSDRFTEGERARKLTRLPSDGTILLRLLQNKKTTSMTIAFQVLGARHLPVSASNSPRIHIIKNIIKHYKKLSKPQQQKLHEAFTHISLTPTSNQTISDGYRLLDLFENQMERSGFRFFLRRHLRYEIQHHPKTKRTTLFREDSFATLLFTRFQKKILARYLTAIVGPQLKKVRTSRLRLDSKDLSRKQLSHLQTRCKKIVDVILIELYKLFSKAKCAEWQQSTNKKSPSLSLVNLKKVYSTIYKVTKKRYGKITAQKQILSFFLFRLVAPAMVTPKNYLTMKRWNPKMPTPLKFEADLLKCISISYREDSVPVKERLTFAKKYIFAKKTQEKLGFLVPLLVT